MRTRSAAGAGRSYASHRHYPELARRPETVPRLLPAVLDRQAALIARWQLVGFIHGVMNTDNMAISGETIDYGPCAFMNAYDPDTVFSSIDHGGRYAYGNQPAIAQWNLARFAETLLPLLHDGSEQRRRSRHRGARRAFAACSSGTGSRGCARSWDWHRGSRRTSSWCEALLDWMHGPARLHQHVPRLCRQPSCRCMTGIATPEFLAWYTRWWPSFDELTAGRPPQRIR